MSKDLYHKEIAHLIVKEDADLYRIIDFLNKNLKDRDLIFGLSMDEVNKKITIYDSSSLQDK